MAYLIAAVVMTSSLLEGHSPNCKPFNCDIWYLWCIVWSFCICRAFCVCLFDDSFYIWLLGYAAWLV